MHETETKLQQDENLRKAADRVRQELADADRNDVDARYAVARICSDVKEQYGRPGLAFLESQLGLAPSTLYRYVKVPEVWAPEVFKAATAKPNSKSLPLSWSHWELLATVKDGRRRKALLERTLKESLTVRDLRLAITDANETSADVSDEARADETNVEARVLASSLAGIAKQVEHFEKHVLAKTAKAKTRPTSEELSDLENVSKAITRSIEALSGIAARITEVTTRVMALPENPTTSSHPPPVPPEATS